MTPVELKEERQDKIAEMNALKKIFGGLLLESNGAASPEDIAYYQRKFREAQQAVRR